MRIFKIMSDGDWAGMRERRQYDGSGDDVRDGFIHLSSGDQVAGTLAAHFAGARDLMLLAVDTAALDPALLKWEVSRGGERFPHYFAALPLAAIVANSPIPLTERGHHVPAL